LLRHCEERAAINESSHSEVCALLLVDDVVNNIHIANTLLSAAPDVNTALVKLYKSVRFAVGRPGFESLAESDQKTLKVDIHSFPA